MEKRRPEARLIGDLKMSEDVDQVTENPTLPAETIDQPMKLSMCKRGDVTYYTLEADASEAKNHMRKFGTKSLDFFYGLLQQIVNAGSKGAYPDEQGIKFMLGFITGNKPRDEIEATLLAQIGACQVATMRMANRLAHAETLQAQDSAERAFNKLARTSAALVETFQRYRAASDHKVIVQHVSVNDGGQAIVGNVTPRARRMALKKRGRVTPALADGRRAAIEPQRTPVPLQRRLKDDN
jgi:hypothetical protein